MARIVSVGCAAAIVLLASGCSSTSAPDASRDGAAPALEADSPEADAAAPVIEAGADATLAGDASSDASADGAPTDAMAEAASPCASTCGTPSCGACPTTPTVSIFDGYQNVTYAIDAYEATNADYARFLAAGVDPAIEPAVCAFNKTFVPSQSWPATAGNATRPVEGVNWCDAYAFCAWSGKRLCGSIADGGVVSSVYQLNSDQAEWFRACTGARGGTGPGGFQTFPYADHFDASACNGASYDAGGTIAVGQAAGCLGGIAGLYDMSGNVSEWENSCVEEDGGPGRCSWRGGSYVDDDAGALRCGSASTGPRTLAPPGMGIRCCKN
jgi:sulfatase modifying factor 1